MSLEETPSIPPITVTDENVEDVVRVVKAGLHYERQVGEETTASLRQWLEDRENEIHQREHNELLHPVVEPVLEEVGEEPPPVELEVAPAFQPEDADQGIGAATEHSFTPEEVEAFVDRFPNVELPIEDELPTEDEPQTEGQE